MSVSTQLVVLIGALLILLLTLAGTAQRFAGAAENSTATRLELDAANLWSLCAAIALISVLLLCPLAVAVIRRFSFRLEDITTKMLAISRNETDVKIPFIHDHDELGDMARAVHVFKANALSLINSQELIEQLNVRFDAALNNMGRGLSMFDNNEQLVVCNEQFQTMYGLEPKLCQPGVALRDLIAMGASREPMSKSARASHISQWYDRHSRLMASNSNADMVFKTFTGRMVQVTYEPMPGGGCVAVHEDITEKCQRDKKINYLARNDSLTGVANRYHFREQLDRHFANCSPKGSFAIHLLDLDQFKDVNDTLGHAVGDVLLRLAAARITKSMRKGDFIARLGGDEFAVIQTRVNQSTQAMAAADRLISILSAPFQIQGQSVMIGASIGIVMVPEHASTPDDAIKKADIALYRAKDDGRGGAVLFKPQLESLLRSRHQLGVDLRHAVREDELELFYQPIVSLEGSRVSCCEALMRWRHPIRGWVPPDEFIPVAEDLGLIDHLGEWALRKACLQAARWPDDIKVAVNLSSRQFESGDLANITRSALETAELAPERLELEVTESLLLRDDPQTCETLHELRALGVAIALDDFGTGYASLSYLLAFPFDKIKIDRMFVREMVDKDQSAVIVEAIIGLAKSLKIRSVAEGVETIAQHHEVDRLGCDEVQGYLFAKPVSAGEIGEVLTQMEVLSQKVASTIKVAFPVQSESTANQG